METSPGDKEKKTSERGREREREREMKKTRVGQRPFLGEGGTLWERGCTRRLGTSKHNEK